MATSESRFAIDVLVDEPTRFVGDFLDFFALHQSKTQGTAFFTSNRLPASVFFMSEELKCFEQTLVLLVIWKNNDDTCVNTLARISLENHRISSTYFERLSDITANFYNPFLL